MQKYVYDQRLYAAQCEHNVRNTWCLRMYDEITKDPDGQSFYSVEGLVDRTVQRLRKYVKEYESILEAYRDTYKDTKTMHFLGFIYCLAVYYGKMAEQITDFFLTSKMNYIIG